MRLVGLNITKSIILKNNTEALKRELNSKMAELKQRKINVLEKAGYCLEDLQPQYNCKFCNDTGYVKDNYNMTVMCNCIKQRLLNEAFKNSNLCNLENENFENFNNLLYSDERNPAKYKKELSPRENIELIKSKSLQFVDNFETPDTNNLFFSGTTGLGKTFISSCIANEMIKKGKTVLYQTAPILLDNIVKEKLNKSTTKYFELACDAELLIIDDLGTEFTNSLINAEFLNLINIRLLNNSQKPKKTIISSNIDIENLFKRYGERFSSRIIGTYDIYLFYGEDIRLKKKMLQKV